MRRARRSMLVWSAVVALGAALLFARCGASMPGHDARPDQLREPDRSTELRADAAVPEETRAAETAPEPLDTERSSEEVLMREAARVLEQTPQQTLVLIEAADRRFGSAVEARRKLEIEALVRLQRIGLAHAKADDFYRAFPNSPFIREIERRTGYHPRPTGPGE
ncbi:MAG TPA: hypothetical protein VFZ61_16580 [Polyangiales bacterium]